MLYKERIWSYTSEQTAKALFASGNFRIRYEDWTRKEIIKIVE